MKLTTGIVFLAMVSGAAWGQNPAVTNNTKNSQGQKTASSPVKISAKSATPKAKPVAAHQKAQPKQQIAVENQKKPAEAKTDAPKQVNLASRRDPFLSPVV